jgi:DNA repair protein RecN (Recombination protein N)
MLASWRAELATLDALSDLDSLQKKEQQTQYLCWESAKKLHEIRVAAAKKLSKAVTTAIAQLGMGGGKFEVQVITTEALTANGTDDIDFLVAGHAGAEPKPVGKVASGGELSRIALAVAVCTSELAQAPTLIFDEVDSGVGGAVAETVGRLMKQLGIQRQVLCVTHLPQVAACADHHGVVAKTQSKQSTTSRIRMVKGEERVSEIARMLGGEKLSSATLAHAKEMLGTP